MNKFWKDKKVIVTGGAGFLGSRVVKRLQLEGATNIFVVRSGEYDLREKEACQRLFVEHQADLVIHAAGVVGGIGLNQEKPGTLFYDNLSMGMHLMEEARRAGVGKFILIGTICSYPKFTQVPFKEENLWDGYPEETNAPYGLAKRALYVQAAAYRQEFGFNAISLLPVNLYGPRDNFHPDSSHVIPAMIRKFVEARDQELESVTLWGDGSPTREFLYVDDAAEAIVLAAEKYNSPQPVNIGSGQEISIKDLAEQIRKLTGFKGKLAWDTSKPNGQPRRLLDVTKAKEEFGFMATTPFEDGLQRTIKWFLRNKR